MKRGGRWRAYVALGANLGDAEASVRAAAEALAAIPQTRLAACSSLYRSDPVDAAGPEFVNAVAELRTGLAPLELLAELHAIERRFGRVRGVRNAPRTLDLDLLLHGRAVVVSEHLVLPHPRLHQRAFVLAPLAEIAPRLRLPGLGSVSGLLARVARQRVSRIAPTGSEP